MPDLQLYWHNTATSSGSISYRTTSWVELWFLLRWYGVNNDLFALNDYHIRWNAVNPNTP